MVWFEGIAVTGNSRIDTIIVNSALTDVTSGVISSPEVLSIAMPVAPPRISHSIEFQGSGETVVLQSFF